MQRLMFSIVADEGKEARDRASCVRAYEVLERLRRDMDLEPNPSDIDVSPEAKATRMRVLGRIYSGAIEVGSAPPSSTG